MIYCSAWAKELMNKTEAIYIDGTFKKEPKPFSQPYTMAEVENRTADKAIPVAYVLMRHRSKVSYTTLFEHLTAYLGRNENSI